MKRPMTAKQQTGKSLSVTFGPQGIDRRGRDGAVAQVWVPGDRPRAYTITTHGKTAEEVAAEVRKLQSRHEERAAKFEELQSIVDREFAVADERFAIVDCIIRWRGTNAELFVQVAQPSRGTWRVVERISRTYPTVADIPSAGEVVAMARSAAERITETEAAQRELAVNVDTLLQAGRIRSPG